MSKQNYPSCFRIVNLNIRIQQGRQTSKQGVKVKIDKVIGQLHNRYGCNEELKQSFYELKSDRKIKAKSFQLYRSTHKHNISTTRAIHHYPLDEQICGFSPQSYQTVQVHFRTTSTSSGKPPINQPQQSQRPKMSSQGKHKLKATMKAIHKQHHLYEPIKVQQQQKDCFDAPFSVQTFKPTPIITLSSKQKNRRTPSPQPTNTKGQLTTNTRPLPIKSRQFRPWSVSRNPELRELPLFNFDIDSKHFL